MKEKKTIWTTITGGLASVAPMLFSVCKGGACIGVCVSPVASLFGISSATIAASPLVNALEPLLIAISAVSFTASYYSLYVLPKLNSSCNPEGTCGCAPTDTEKRKINITKAIFWLGLVLSIGFLSYFEYQKYQSATTSAQTECSSSECAPGGCSTETADTTAACGSTCDSVTCGDK